MRSNLLKLFSLLVFIVCANIAANGQFQEGLGIGQKAPELSYKNPDGKVLSLSDLKGQVVLIDFWAAWCGPCRKENPVVVFAYENFKDKAFKGGKGFTIYSVSMDVKKENWVAAIEKDKLSWDYHVSDLGGWKSEPAKRYGVGSIPTNFLIDGNGIILAKNLRGRALIDTLNKLVQK